MTTKRYAIIRNSVVENVVLWDGVGTWAPPAGSTVVQSDEAAIRDRWDGLRFVRVPEAPAPLTPEQQAWAGATAAERLSMAGKRLGLER